MINYRGMWTNDVTITKCFQFVIILTMITQLSYRGKLSFPFLTHYLVKYGRKSLL